MKNIKQKEKLWITWEYQVRNRSMAKKLNVPLVEVIHDEHSKLRYFKCIYQTISLIHKNKPRTVFYQSPSIILALLITVLKFIYRFKTIMDCHNAGYKPLEGKSKLLNCIAKFSLKRADLVIVHNELINNDVKSINTNTLVMSDPLPEVKKSQKCSQSNSGVVVFICRWSLDEPYHEVLKAATILLKEMPHVKIKITGNPPKEIKDSTLPENVELMGFLSNQDYADLLHHSALLIALTTRTDSLNCAGYEAMAYEKPMILSDSKLLKNFFSKGYEFTMNSAEHIAQTINSALIKQDELKREIQDNKHTYQKESEAAINSLLEIIK